MSPRPVLSVCCLTAEPPARVAALMSLFRDVADEIVVAMDSRVDPTGFGPLREVTDTLVRFEYADPPERARPWLVGLCRGSTVLMIDGDEVPSTELLSILPALSSDLSVDQVRIARRWCFPDERTWLAERPWWPDFQRRFVRPGPGLAFDTRFHGGVLPVYPNRCVEESIYHLAHVTRDLQSRRRRAAHYDAARPGMVAVGGGSMNDILYAPEWYATRRPAPTPDEDQSNLRAVLDAHDSSASPHGDMPIVSAEEVGASIAPDPLDAQGYRARLRIVELDRRTDPGIDTHAAVEVLNLGNAPLCFQDSPGAQLRVATRLMLRGGSAPVAETTFTALPCDIPVGGSRVVDASVAVPVMPGLYDLEARLQNMLGRSFEGGTRRSFLVGTRWARFAL